MNHLSHHRLAHRVASATIAAGLLAAASGCASSGDHADRPADSLSSPTTASVPAGSVATSPTTGPSGPTASSPSSESSSYSTWGSTPTHPTGSSLPSYDPTSVTPTTKPTGHHSSTVSLGNIGSPTVDSRHPNGSAGHLIPWSSDPQHCILVFNQTLARPFTIVGVSFSARTDPGAAPLTFAAANTDPNCGWLHAFPDRTGLRSPTCRGETLPLVTGDVYSATTCVLRADIPDPTSDVDRFGSFSFVFQTTCVDRMADPCSRLKQAPSASHPVTVRWSPRPFRIAACGRDAPRETDQDAAMGICLDETPSASPSSSTAAAPPDPSS